MFPVTALFATQRFSRAATVFARPAALAQRGRPSVGRRLRLFLSRMEGRHRFFWAILKFAAGLVANILTGRHYSSVARAVMGLQQVQTEIVLVITPHRVDMISLILRAIHLNEEAGRLYAVIVQATAFRRAGPSKEGGLLRLLPRQFHALFRHHLRHVRSV